MLPPTAASNTPYTITVSSDKYGEANISDVMFGDVWICSGQSNMQFAVSQVLQVSLRLTNYEHSPLYRHLVGKMK